MRPLPSDPAEQAALQRAVSQTALLLRVAGAERLAAENVFVRAARYGLSTGADYPELRRCLAALARLEDWHDVWAARALEWERRAEAAEGAGRRVTAADAWRRASAYWHVAQINLLDEDPHKAVAHGRCVAAYRRGAAGQRPPAERLESPFPGYFRSPGPGRRPGVILLNGANTVKEELHHYSDDFLARGLCTLVFDAPGQGELAARYGHPGVTVDGVCAAVRSCLDYLAGRPEVDPGRVALWGVSLGGFLALRSACDEPRLRGVVSLGGFYDLRALPRLSAILHEEFRVLFGLDSFAAVDDYVRAACTLKGHLPRLEAPYLVVHGARDDLLDLEEARQMASGSRGELWVVEDGVHGCYNRDPEVGPAVADWVAEHV